MPLYGGQVGGARGIGRVGNAPKKATEEPPGRGRGGKLCSVAAGKVVKRKKAKKPTAASVDPEEAKALRLREAARKRVEQRTRSQFGFS